MSVSEAASQEVGFLTLASVCQGGSCRVGDPLSLLGQGEVQEGNLLAVSNKFGYAVVAHSADLLLYGLAELRSTLKQAEPLSEASVTPAKRWTVPQQVVAVKFAYSDKLVLASLLDGSLLAFRLKSLVQGDTNPVIHSNAGFVPQDILPNPAPGSPLVALVPSPFSANPQLALFNADTNTVSTPFPQAVQATCASWSVKGKQIVVGTRSGAIAQLTPEGEIKAEIPPPPALDSNTSWWTRSLSWIENNVFLVVYAKAQQPQSPDHDDEVYIINRTPGGTFEYVHFFDPTPAFGMVERQGRRWTAWLKQWNPFKHLIIMVNAPSPDIGALGQQDGWANYDWSEMSRPMFPTTSSGADSCALGFELDLTASDSQTPYLLLYTSDGILAIWQVKNESNPASPAVRAPKDVITQEDAPDEADGQVATASSSAAAPSAAQPAPTTSAFGSFASPSAASPFGTPAKPVPAPAFGASAFGSSSFGAGASKPAFGSSAFGSSSFGATPSTPASSSASSTTTPAASSAGGFAVFGAAKGTSSPFGAAASTASPFGSGSSFGTSAFGSKPATFGAVSAASQTAPSTGFAGFGSSGSTAGGFGSFAKSTPSTSSPFGASSTSAFGSTSSSPFGSLAASTSKPSFTSTAVRGQDDSDNEEEMAAEPEDTATRVDEPPDLEPTQTNLDIGATMEEASRAPTPASTSVPSQTSAPTPFSANSISFGGFGLGSAAPSTSSTTSSMFGAASAAPATSSSTSATTPATSEAPKATSFGFGAFGSASSDASKPTSFGFGSAASTAPATSNAPASQEVSKPPTFGFGSAPPTSTSASTSTETPKPSAFGFGSAAATPTSSEAAKPASFGFGSSAPSTAAKPDAADAPKAEAPKSTSFSLGSAAPASSATPSTAAATEAPKPAAFSFGSSAPASSASPATSESPKPATFGYGSAVTPSSPASSQPSTSAFGAFSGSATSTASPFAAKSTSSAFGASPFAFGSAKPSTPPAAPAASTTAESTLADKAAAEPKATLPLASAEKKDEPAPASPLSPSPAPPKDEIKAIKQEEKEVDLSAPPAEQRADSTKSLFGFASSPPPRSPEQPSLLSRLSAAPDSPEDAENDDEEEEDDKDYDSGERYGDEDDEEHSEDDVEPEDEEEELEEERGEDEEDESEKEDDKKASPFSFKPSTSSKPFSFGTPASTSTPSSEPSKAPASKSAFSFGGATESKPTADDAAATPPKPFFGFSVASQPKKSSPLSQAPSNFFSPPPTAKSSSEAPQPTSSEPLKPFAFAPPAGSSSTASKPASSFSFAPASTSTPSSAASAPPSQPSTAAVKAKPADTAPPSIDTAVVPKIGENFTASQVPAGKEVGMAGEFVKAYALLQKEFEVLRTNTERCRDFVEQIKRSSSASSQPPQSFATDAWTFGDLKHLKGKTSALKPQMEAIVQESQQQRRRIAELQAMLLKAETKREEASRFLRAREDPVYAKMVRVRQLGPEHVENQKKIRLAIESIRNRIEQLEQHIMTLKGKITDDKLGRSSFRAPTLDSVNRTVRNITAAVSDRSFDIDDLALRLESVRMNTPAKSKASRLAAVTSNTTDETMSLSTPVKGSSNSLVGQRESTTEDATVQKAIRARQGRLKLKEIMLELRKEPLLTVQSEDVTKGGAALTDLQLAFTKGPITGDRLKPAATAANAEPETAALSAPSATMNWLQSSQPAAGSTASAPAPSSASASSGFPAFQAPMSISFAPSAIDLTSATSAASPGASSGRSHRPASRQHGSAVQLKKGSSTSSGTSSEALKGFSFARD